jgi:hypothetical protein
MNHEQFLQQLTEHFPEVVAEIDDYARGLLHCEMAVFRRVVESEMDRGKAWRVTQYLRFLDECRSAADPALANAIDISFLEDFALGEFTEARYRAIHQLMPPRLREEIVSANARWK